MRHSACLAEYLFDTTLVHRLCAYTEWENVAEQKSLRGAGSAARDCCARPAFGEAAGGM